MGDPFFLECLAAHGRSDSNLRQRGQVRRIANAARGLPHKIREALLGGVRDATDLAALAQIGVAATVCGKALQEKRITHWELQPFLPDALFPASMSSTAR